MITAIPTNKILRSTKGQSLVELTLIVPLMLLLVFGVVEVGSVISTYLTLTHTTREGANLTSRGTVPRRRPSMQLSRRPRRQFETIISAQWKIIYTQNRSPPAPAPPCIKSSV